MGIGRPIHPALPPSQFSALGSPGICRGDPFRLEICRRCDRFRPKFFVWGPGGAEGPWRPRGTGWGGVGSAARAAARRNPGAGGARAPAPRSEESGEPPPRPVRPRGAAHGVLQKKQKNYLGPKSVAPAEESAGRRRTGHRARWAPAGGSKRGLAATKGFLRAVAPAGAPRCPPMGTGAVRPAAVCALIAGRSDPRLPEPLQPLETQPPTLNFL